MKKHLKSLLGVVILVFTVSGCYREPRPSKEVVVTVTGECDCEITFYGSMGSSYSIDYDCRDGNYYPIYLEEGTYRVVADAGGGDLVEIEFVKGKYAQELGVVF